MSYVCECLVFESDNPVIRAHTQNETCEVHLSDIYFLNISQIQRELDPESYKNLSSGRSN